jgi:hypothetical protein
MHFREEPVTPVYRHWMCEQAGCNGELLSTGESITRLSTRWKHRCDKCGHEDWANASYPLAVIDRRYGFATAGSRCGTVKLMIRSRWNTVYGLAVTTFLQLV